VLGDASGLTIRNDPGTLFLIATEALEPITAGVDIEGTSRVT